MAPTITIQLNGHVFEQALGFGDGQWSLVCCSLWDRRVRHDWATELNWTSHCFNMHFPRCWTSFMCLFVICLSLLRSIQIVYPFLNWAAFLLGFKSFLYILVMSPLSDLCFESIFSKSVAWLFILLIVAFMEKIF